MKDLLFIVYFVFIFLTGCNTAVKKKDAKIKIVATTSIVQDAVEQIVGERAVVETLMGAGVDPHLYKATQGDIEKLNEADIIFYNGLHLEGKMTEVLLNLAKRKAVWAVSEGIGENELRILPGSDNLHDPHIWFDVRLWQKATAFIAQTMGRLDTINAAEYQLNAKKYLQQLDSLHQQTLQQIASIPADQRILVTAHDAFAYYSVAYKIEVKSLQGISTASEFGLQDVTNLVNFITERKIKAVFIESSVPTRSIEAVVEGCKAKGHIVELGDFLYSDALGEANTPTATYIGMVKYNTESIVKALKAN